MAIGRQETLLPCPLPACGGEAIDKGHGILCRKCGIWLGDGTQARESGGVHKLWNTRPDSPAKYVPELVRALKYYAKQWPGNDEPNIAQQALSNLPEELRK